MGTNLSDHRRLLEGHAACIYKHLLRAYKVALDVTDLQNATHVLMFVIRCKCDLLLICMDQSEARTVYQRPDAQPLSAATFSISLLSRAFFNKLPAETKQTWTPCKSSHERVREKSLTGFSFYLLILFFSRSSHSKRHREGPETILRVIGSSVSDGGVDPLA